MEKETKRILLEILETMQEQQSRYPVTGVADRIDRITQQVHDVPHSTVDYDSASEPL